MVPLVLRCALLGMGIAGHWRGRLMRPSRSATRSRPGLVVGLGGALGAIAFRSPRSYLATVLGGLAIGAGIGMLATLGAARDTSPMSQMALAAVLLGAGLPTIKANLLLGEEAGGEHPVGDPSAAEDAPR